MASRVLTVNLDIKYYQSSIPLRRITYSKDSIDLSEDEYNKLLSEIPSFWNSENDKLIRFVYFDDGTYFCERIKKAFNYSTRETEDKIYRFDYASIDDGKALYAFFVEKYAKIKIDRTENLYDEILNEIGDTSVVKLSLLDARDQLLKESDFLMLPDYPLSEEERQKWSTYRQQLRDLTTQEAWISNDIINIQFPVSPNPYSQLSSVGRVSKDLSSIPPNLTEDLLKSITDKPVEDIIKNISQITIKFDILKSISKLKIPVLNVNYDNIVNAESNYQEFLKEVQNDALDQQIITSSWWDTAIQNIDEKIAQINKMLKSYNLTFTINDILNSIVEENKLSPEQIEVNTIIEEL